MLAAEFGLAATVASPISVAGRVWGLLTGTSAARPLPAGTEARLDQFAQLVSAAPANSQARDDLHTLVDEQTALRRVAELAAHDPPADQLLQAVAVEASAPAGVEFGTVLRYLDADGGNEMVALDSAPDNFVLGMRTRAEIPALLPGARQAPFRVGIGGSEHHASRPLQRQQELGEPITVPVPRKDASSSTTSTERAIYPCCQRRTTTWVGLTRTRPPAGPRSLSGQWGWPTAPVIASIRVEHPRERFPTRAVNPRRQAAVSDNSRAWHAKAVR